MTLAVKTTLRTARRESAAVVRALGDGKQFLLLLRVASEDRQTEARLSIRRLEFFLVPDDRDRDGIRPEHSAYLEGPSDVQDGKLTLRYRAVVTEGVMILEGAQLEGLSDFHIWDEASLARRATYDPMDPAFLVTCKVQKLDPPITIPWTGEGVRGGWIELDADLPPVSFTPVVEHKDYLKVALDVKKAFATVQKNPLEAPPEEPAAASAPATPPAG